MSETQSAGIMRFVPMILTICAAATFIGLIAGAFAGLGYGLQYKYHPEGDADYVLGEVAGVLGTSASAIAGVIWSIVMVRRARRGRSERLMQTSILWGVILGVLATLIMHGGLIFTIVCYAPGRLDSAAAGFVGIGLMCGVVAGLVLGTIGGWLCIRAAGRVGVLRNEDMLAQAGLPQ